MNTTAPFAVIGLGGAGGRIVARLAQMEAAKSLRLLALDTDRRALEATGLPETDRFLLGADWYKGAGCGGDVTNGQRAMGNARAALTEWLRGIAFVLVVGGLGKGTASGGAGVLQSIARKLDIPIAFQLTLPFSIEGYTPRHIAEETLRQELLPVADAVWCIPNDLLFSTLPSTTSLEDAFRFSDTENARTALALTGILRYGGLLSVQMADFSALLKQKKSVCSLGSGFATTMEHGEARCSAALEQLLESPLLGGREKLASADAVVVSLLGGADLSIGETREALAALGRFTRPDAKLLVSAGTTAELNGAVQLVALAIYYDPLDAPEQQKTAENAVVRPRPGRRRSDPVNDMMDDLPLETFTKGIMEQTLPVMHNNEDLDIPTYQRRRISLDIGQ